MGKIQRKKIGQILCEKGFITKAQLEIALREQKKREDQMLGQILLELGYITEDQLQKALELQNKLIKF